MKREGTTLELYIFLIAKVCLTSQKFCGRKKSVKATGGGARLLMIHRFEDIGSSGELMQTNLRVEEELVKIWKSYRVLRKNEMNGCMNETQFEIFSSTLRFLEDYRDIQQLILVFLPSTFRGCDQLNGVNRC